LSSYSNQGGRERGRAGTYLLLVTDDHAGGEGGDGGLELVLDQDGGDVLASLEEGGREGGRAGKRGIWKT